IDFAALGERTVWIDCDVLEADGGTRCAAITGGHVALELALKRQVGEGKLDRVPLTQSVAAVSCGVVEGEALLDLDYSEDSRAAVADDSGIAAAALDGAPGVHSARYAGEGATDEQNLAKLLAEVPPDGDGRVAYVCVLALVRPDGRETVVEGRCEGELTHSPR